MRLLRYLFLAVLFAGTTIPSLAYAQESRSFIESIVPQTGTCTCENVQVQNGEGTSVSAPSYGCILDTVQRAINALVFVGVIVVVLCIVYAAFLFMTSAGRVDALIRGRRVITNSIVGLIIILLAWVAIDFLMKFVYKPEAVISGTAQLGPWNAIWSAAEDSKCLVVRSPAPITSGSINIPVGTALSGGASGNCSTAALTNDWGDASVAQVFSCMLKNESRCGDTADNPTSTARGRYQIVLGLNDQGHNLNFPVCTQAARQAGYQVDGDLNCSRYVSGGEIKAQYRSNMSDPSNPAGACVAAQSNASCNTAAAQWLFNFDRRAGNDGFGPWRGSSWNQRCINDASFRAANAT